MTISPRHRETCWALLVLTIATLCCFHKLVRRPASVLVGPQNFGANDLTNYYIPSREFAARTLAEEGGLPFWNPAVCLGLPYTGNPQSALYYPPNWVCHALPAGLALSWLLVAHHLFAGAGVYLLARSYGIGWGGGVAGGVIFLAAPFLVAQSAEGHYAQVCAVAWAPWAFLAFESVRRRERFGALALAACLAMSFFCGHAQETYYLTLILTLFACGDAVRSLFHGDRRNAGRLLLDWGRVGLFTAGLVAIDLVPIFINSRMTLRPALEQIEGDFGWASFRLEGLQELLAPFALTRPELWHAGTTPFWEKVCYFGVVPLVLAAAAPLIARRRPLTWRMLALWIATLLFAFGTNGPFYSSLAPIIPGLSWFRLPSRVLFFTSFATALLGAITVDELLHRLQSDARDRLRLLGGVAAAAIALLIGWSCLTVALDGRQAAIGLFGPPAAIALATPVLAAALAAIGRSRLEPLILGSLLLACIVELSLFSTEVTETARLLPLVQRDPELAALLEGAPAAERGRVLAVQDVVSDDDASRHGLRKVRGYDPAGPANYLLLLHQSHVAGAEPLEPMGFLPVDVAGLRGNMADLLGIEYAIQLRRAGDEPGVPPEGWEPVHAGRIGGRARIDGAAAPRLHYDYEVLRNPDALPRAFVVGEVRELNGYGGFSSQLDALDFRREVVLREDVLPEGPRAAFRRAAIAQSASNRLEVHAELDAPGYLVLSELSFPGWRASVEGRSLPVLKANMAFRAVPLPAGRHQIVLEFRPPGLTFGAIITAVTVLGVIVKLISRPTGSAPDRNPEPVAGRTVLTPSATVCCHLRAGRIDRVSPPGGANR